MCNVPADAKLRYINSAEKKRLTQIMTYTGHLLRNEPTALRWHDKIIKQLMAYKPELDKPETVDTRDLAAEEEEDRQKALLELSCILESAKDDPILQNIIRHIAISIEAKKADKSGHHTGARESSSCSSSVSVNPVQLGSQTSKALIAGFYMLMKEKTIPTATTTE